MSVVSGAKRKLGSADEDARTKRARIDAGHAAAVASTSEAIPGPSDGEYSMAVEEDTVPGRDESTSDSHEVQKGEGAKRKGKQKAHVDLDVETMSTTPKHKYRKLAPPRPYPTVPTSVSATGPRSAHVEGKNRICVTRKTPLGAYLRRCKDVVLKDGFKTLYLSAMGAAIPHLMQLALSLPSILPYDSAEIQTEVLTGTVEVQDEVIPDDDDEDLTYRTRGKSSVSVVIKIGNGIDEGPRSGKGKRRQAQSKDNAATGGKRKDKQKSKSEDAAQNSELEHTRVVIRAEDMDDDSGS